FSSPFSPHLKWDQNLHAKKRCFGTCELSRYSGSTHDGSNGWRSFLLPTANGLKRSFALRPERVSPNLICSVSNSTVLRCAYAQRKAGFCLGAGLTHISDSTPSFQ